MTSADCDEAFEDFPPLGDTYQDQDYSPTYFTGYDSCATWAAAQETEEAGDGDGGTEAGAGETPSGGGASTASPFRSCSSDNDCDSGFACVRGTCEQVVLLENPLAGDVTDIPTIIGRAIRVILGILGTLTLFVFVDGAFHWVTSAGYPQRVQKGVRTMLFAVAGLFIIFASYGILSALFSILETKGG